MLANLVIAVESEAQIVDIARVSGFMQKVRSPSRLTFTALIIHVRSGMELYKNR